MSPPLAYHSISMPSEKDLLRCKQDELARKVITFGGYESVARRLGLAYFDGTCRQMDERRFRGAKILFRERNKCKVLGRSLLNHTFQLRSDGGVSGRRRKGLAWSEELVVEEL